MASTSTTVSGKSELVERFLSLETLDTNLFRSKNLFAGRQRTNRVYGGLMIGQSLIAAAKTVPENVHVHSLHSYFLRPGNAEKPILYYVDPVRNGQSFYTRNVKACQNGETAYSAMFSFSKEEPDSILHQDTMPRVPPPEDLEEVVDLYKRLSNDPIKLRKSHFAYMGLWLEGTNTFSVKPVMDNNYNQDPKGPEPRANLWVKVNGTIADGEHLHQSAAGYVSDFFLVGAALLPSNMAGQRMGMVASLDHTMWFHNRDFRMDDWMLYETWSSKAGASRCLSYGRLWTRDGNLAISTAQEGLVRGAKAKL